MDDQTQQLAFVIAGPHIDRQPLADLAELAFLQHHAGGGRAQLVLQLVRRLHWTRG